MSVARKLTPSARSEPIQATEPTQDAAQIRAEITRVDSMTRSDSVQTQSAALQALFPG